MAGHESAALWTDVQLRDQIESDRFGRYVRRYGVNGAAPRTLLDGVRGAAVDFPMG
jgi:hypothetical protein